MHISELSPAIKAHLDFIYETGRELALQNQRVWNPDDRFSVLAGTVSAVYFPVTERLQTHIIDDPRTVIYRGAEYMAEIDRYVIVRPQQDQLSLGEQVKHAGRRRSVAFPLRATNMAGVAEFIEQYRADFSTRQAMPEPSRRVLYQPWG